MAKFNLGAMFPKPTPIVWLTGDEAEEERQEERRRELAKAMAERWAELERRNGRQRLAAIDKAMEVMAEVDDADWEAMMTEFRSQR